MSGVNRTLLGVLSGTLLQISGQNDDNEIQREKHFELNLKRMLGKSDAVTVDCMLEFLVHLNNEHLSDLQFIEEEYISVVLMDVTLDLDVCSVEVCFYFIFNIQHIADLFIHLLCMHSI
jgi:hypothetical protein